jgi:virginiamycin B lyase
MKTFARNALSVGIVATLLSGCGGRQQSTGALGAIPLSGTLSTHSDRGEPPILEGTSNKASPVIEEYPIKSEHLVQPLDVAFDASNNLWFNAFYYYLGRRGKKGFITAHSLRVRERPYGHGSMAVGPKGVVYFTDSYAGSVGKIEPDGKIDLYFKDETSIKSGLVFTHGHLWVVLPGILNSVLDEVSVDGKLLKQVVLPGNYCGAESIGASADGTLWVGYSANCPAIVRVTENGKSTVFPIVAADGVWRVVKGPDGNMWFAAADNPTTNDYIGKITPNGQITKYPLSNQVSGMVLGPDGNWWLTMPFVGKIVVMSLQGRILHGYTLPHAVNGSQPNFQLGSIVLGRDGNLWFPEGYRNNIGELKF